MNTSTPDALMLLTADCPHCPAVLDGLSQLVKKGKIGKLEIVNLEQHPEIAQQHGVRSVPWVRIGPFELTGKQSPAELEKWISLVASDEGMKDYIAELINTGSLNKVEELIQKNPEYFNYLLTLFSDSETSLNIRVGIGALMEMFADSPVMYDHIEALGKLSKHESPQVRTDACHYLSLTGHQSARPYIEDLLNDSDASVKEVAEESLEELSENNHS